MTLQELLQDIHSLEEDLLRFERRYGVRSETFYAAYASGEGPSDSAWVLDFAEWAGAYKTWLMRQSHYGSSLQDQCNHPLVRSRVRSCAWPSE
jgi:hypothetical protein